MVKEMFSAISDATLEILGTEFLSKRKFEEAIRAYTEAINRHPADARYYKWRGHCYREMNDLNKAAFEFQKALLLDPHSKDNQDLFRQALLAANINFHGLAENALFVFTNSDLEMLANKFFFNEKYQEALLCFNEAIKRNPKIEYYRARANCHKKMGNLFLATFDLWHVVQINPNNKEDRLLLSQTFFDTEKYTEATEQMLAVGDVNEIVKLAQKLFSKGKYEEATRCYSWAIKFDPSEWRYYRERGLCFLRVKNLILAISDFQKAVQIEPSNERNRILLKHVLINSGKLNELTEETLVHFNDTELEEMGNSLFSKGKLEEAIRFYTSAIEKNPKAQYYRRRGICYQEINNVDTAFLDFRRMMQIDPRDQENRVFFRKALFLFNGFKDLPEETLFLLNEEELEKLGKTFFFGNKFAESLHCYNAAIERNLFNGQYYKWRGLCNWKMKDFDGGLAEFEKAVVMDPQDENNRIVLCTALFEMGRYDEVMVEMLSLNDSRLADLAFRFVSINKLDEAVKCFSEALKKNPTKTVYYNGRANCYWKKGNLVKAIADLKRVVLIEPSNVKYRITLCNVLIQAERFEEAQNIISKTDLSGLSPENIAKVTQTRQIIEISQKNKKLKDLEVYLKTLVIQDTNREIDRLMRELHGNPADVNELKNNIIEVKFNGEHNLNKITYAIAEYNDRRRTQTDKTSEGDTSKPMTPSRETEPPDYFLDKISLEVMTNPVITPSGITYEESQISRHLQRKKHDPTTRRPLHVRQLIENRALKDAIEAWKEGS